MENKAKMPCKRLDSRSMWIWLDILRVVQAIARFIHRSAIRQIANLRSRSTAKSFPGYQQIQTDPFHSLPTPRPRCQKGNLHRRPSAQSRQSLSHGVCLLEVPENETQMPVVKCRKRVKHEGTVRSAQIKRTCALVKNFHLKK